MFVGAGTVEKSIGSEDKVVNWPSNRSRVMRKQETGERFVIKGSLANCGPGEGLRQKPLKLQLLEEG